MIFTHCNCWHFNSFNTDLRTCFASWYDAGLVNVTNLAEGQRKDGGIITGFKCMKGSWKGREMRKCLPPHPHFAWGGSNGIRLQQERLRWNTRKNFYWLNCERLPTYAMKSALSLILYFLNFLTSQVLEMGRELADSTRFFPVLIFSSVLESALEIRQVLSKEKIFWFYRKMSCVWPYGYGSLPYFGSLMLLS